MGEESKRKEIIINIIVFAVTLIINVLVFMKFDQEYLLGKDLVDYSETTTPKKIIAFLLWYWMFAYIFAYMSVIFPSIFRIEEKKRNRNFYIYWVVY